MSTAPQRVLVTGSGGYIGAVLTPLLVARGHDVVGLDTGYFDGCDLLPEPVAIPSMRRDIRDLKPTDLRGFDAVIHLAALSNDPIGNLSEAWTADINDRGTVRLAELARAAGVRRFLFASSCIMYGLSSTETVDETSALDPQTIYARSKVRAEQALTTLASDRFSPVYLRNGTIYGLSPRMRFDTVLNNLVGSAVTSGLVVVYSDGTPWRPVVHVEDVVRAFAHVLAAPTDLVHDQAFNVGADELNHQVIELARYAVDAVEGARLELRSSPDADQRTYRTSFAKFARTFPEFRFEWRAREGARDLAARLQQVGLTRAAFEGQQFVRLRWLRSLIDSGRLDGNLRWVARPEALAAPRGAESEEALPVGSPEARPS
jgi:nucleoside-diphosphate-sugar epimerase